MIDTIIVVCILAIAGFFAAKGIFKTFKGKGGCGGSCACTEKKQQTCGTQGQVIHELEIERRC